MWHSLSDGYHGSLKAKRARATTVKHKSTINLYNKMCEMISWFAELLAIQEMTDTIILQVNIKALFLLFLFLFYIFLTFLFLSLRQCSSRMLCKEHCSDHWERRNQVRRRKDQLSSAPMYSGVRRKISCLVPHIYWCQKKFSCPVHPYILVSDLEGCRGFASP